jgi:mitogen-activated protein kinase 15
MDSALAKDCIEQINCTRKKSYNQIFPEISEDALDLIKNLLVFNPNHRFTAEQALKHRYLREFSNPS